MDKTADFQLADVELLDEQVAYKGFYQIRCVELRHKLFAGGWGGPIKRELFRRHEAVGVLPYDPELDAVALIEQFRIGAYSHMQRNQRQGSPWMLELVAGLIDKDESVEAVGRREAVEEAGATVTELEPIHHYYSSPGGSDEFCYLFCGRTDLHEVSGIHGLPEEGEDIRVRVYSIEQCKQMLAGGEVRNAMTLIGLQWLLLNHQSLRDRWLQEGA